MKSFAVLAAFLTICNAVPLHLPLVQSYVSAVPTVLTHSRVAIPASIPTTVSEVITSARTVPEHRFTSSEWEQPTSLISPAVRQYTVRSDIPVAVRSVSYEPAVHYTNEVHSYPVAVPTLTAPYTQKIIQQTYLKR